MSLHFFPLSWHVNRYGTGGWGQPPEIQVFGWIQEAGQSTPKTACLRVTDFKPYMYIKLPASIEWTEATCFLVIRALQSLNIRCGTFNARPCQMRGVYSTVHAPLSTYLFVECSSDSVRYSVKTAVGNSFVVNGLGPLELKCYEANASPVLQLICRCNITTADWFEVQDAAFKRQAEPKLTSCEREYVVHWKKLQPCSRPTPQMLPRPVMLGYDIETYSHNPAVFCDAKHPEDVIFQISMVFACEGSPPEEWLRYLLSLETPVMDDPSVTLLCFTKEKELLLKFAELIRLHNPMLLIGYNTFGFDNKYMVQRAQHWQILDEFSRYGFTVENSRVFEDKWSSSAYGAMKMFFLDTKGRIHVDLMILISRDYKLDDYKLNTVAQLFLQREKDPVTPQQMFTYYKHAATTHAPSADLGVVGKYCVKDSVLVIELFLYLQYWQSLVSMAKICYVPVAHLFSRGQQIKVFSQVYKYCYDAEIVVENHSFQVPEGDDEITIQGASVLDAVKGLHHNVVSFDFASLYPSIIISHNIDYSTFVSVDDPIDDSKCHVVEWQEHFGCGCPGAEPPKKVKNKSTIICQMHRFRWLKEPAGVVPTIIKHLLAARKETKARMKRLEEGSIEYALANQLQNAFKVSANSMYGVLTARVGALVFPFAGMCVTAIGRRSLATVKRSMEIRYNAVVIYGDTDSVYVLFKNVSLTELESHCLRVSEEVSAQFPAPMKLEYEGKIYLVLFLMSKKRYAFLAQGRAELEYKGILLKRRDSARLICSFYKRILLLMMDAQSRTVIEAAFFECLNILASGAAPAAEFALTTSIKDIDDLSLRDKNSTKMYCGQYVVSRLHDDPKKRAAQLKRKRMESEDNFHLRSLPNQVQLAIKMRERGQHIQSGARISMLYVKNRELKVEELEYFNTHCCRRYIDTTHYVELFLTPVQELFTAYFEQEELRASFHRIETTEAFFKGIRFTIRQHEKLNAHLNRLFIPITFEEHNMTEYTGSHSFVRGAKQ